MIRTVNEQRLWASGRGRQSRWTESLLIVLAFPSLGCARGDWISETLTLITRTPLPLATSASNSGASSRRKVFSAISSVFQITAVAFSTFLNRLAAAVRSRTAANGDSTGFDVRRCFQCSRGNA